MKYILCTAAVIIAMTMSSCTTHKESKERPAHARVPRKEAVDIARAEAARIWYDTGRKKMEIFRNKMPWYAHHPDLKEYFDTSDYYRGIKNKLDNRDYWAVYFSPVITGPGQPVHGSDFCVFVDSATGEVITIFVGAVAR